MKRFISVLLAALLCALCVLPSFAAEPDRRLNSLLLGDSIAAGFGIDNPREACYGRIVADTNGYVYHNLARTATDSYELIEYMSEGSFYDTYYDIRGLIADADIISLSIGSNDYFDNDDVVKLAVGAFFRVNGKQLNEIADGFYANLCTIINMIRELNPDCAILVQNVYNVWYGIGGPLYRSITGRVNGVIDKYLAEGHDNVYLCDISPAMDRKPENLADDCVHPNAAGNVAIAACVLQRLKELGLGENTEPVVNCEGVDYNFFEETMDNKFLAKFVTFLIKVLTGNIANIGRK